MEGLTFEDCEPIRGVDAIEHPIRWQETRLEDHLRKPIRLEMKFYGANIYGLRADWQWLDAREVITDFDFVRHVRLEQPLTVKVDGRAARGVVRYQP